jgi:hypothetical protein
LVHLSKMELSSFIIYKSLKKETKSKQNKTKQNQKVLSTIWRELCSDAFNASTNIL